MNPSHHGRMAKFFAAVVTLLGAISIQASQVDVQILAADYSIALTVVSNHFSYSRTTVSAAPFSDSMDILGRDYSFDPSCHALAEGRAGLFEVEGHTFAHGISESMHANNEVRNQIQFSPVADQTQTIGIQATFGGLESYTTGSARLFDLSLNQEVWTYGWGYFGIGADTLWEVETAFQASHQYELTMMTAMDASNDSESVLLQVTGLAAIPEPSAIAIFSLSCAMLLTGRNRRSP